MAFFVVGDTRPAGVHAARKRGRRGQDLATAPQPTGRRTALVIHEICVAGAGPARAPWPTIGGPHCRAGSGTMVSTLGSAGAWVEGGSGSAIGLNDGYFAVKILAAQCRLSRCNLGPRPASRGHLDSQSCGGRLRWCRGQVCSLGQPLKSGQAERLGVQRSLVSLVPAVVGQLGGLASLRLTRTEL